MKIIFINPGHSKTDPGAVSANGVKEADIVASVGRSVSKHLIDVGYTAPVLQHDSLLTVTTAANNWPADVFVSIHCNAAENRLAQGAETWYCSGSAGGEHLARCIQAQIVTSVPVNNRGARMAVPGQNGLYVLTNTNMPACLVELAFLSNDYDEALLINPEWQSEFSRAIARGITDYFAEIAYQTKGE